jgi:FkbM family methyltransferase
MVPVIPSLQVFVDKIREVYGDKDPEVILDIGSRDLDCSVDLLKYFPEARIIAFEPIPWQYNNCLERANKLYNIEVYNFALSDEEGELDFWEVHGNPGGSSMFEPIDVPYSSGSWSKTVVQSRRLDNVLKSLNVSKVDCIWMDTQGSELKVLKGMGTYLDSVRAIHTEACPKPYYKGQVLKSDLENYLIENNFIIDQFIAAPNHPYDEGDLICIKK